MVVIPAEAERGANVEKKMPKTKIRRYRLIVIFLLFVISEAVHVKGGLFGVKSHKEKGRAFLKGESDAGMKR